MIFKAIYINSVNNEITLFKLLIFNQISYLLSFDGFIDFMTICNSNMIRLTSQQSIIMLLISVSKLYQTLIISSYFYFVYRFHIHRT